LKASDFVELSGEFCSTSNSGSMPKWKVRLQPAGTLRAFAGTAGPARETGGDWDYIGERTRALGDPRCARSGGVSGRTRRAIPRTAGARSYHTPAAAV